MQYFFSIVIFTRTAISAKLKECSVQSMIDTAQPWAQFEADSFIAKHFDKPKQFGKHAASFYENRHAIAGHTSH
jgi:hypothetical protein